THNINCEKFCQDTQQTRRVFEKDGEYCCVLSPFDFVPRAFVRILSRPQLAIRNAPRVKIEYGGQGKHGVVPARVTRDFWMLQMRDSLMQRQPAAHSEYVHGNQKRIEIQRLAIPV